VTETDDNLYVAVKEAIIAKELLDGVGGDFASPGADCERLQATVRNLGYEFQAAKLMGVGNSGYWFATIWPRDKSPWTDLDCTICKISSISAERAFLNSVWALIHHNHYKSLRITR
jgi:hypothetical protein